MTTPARPPAAPVTRDDLRVGDKMWHVVQRAWVTVGYTSHYVAPERVRVNTDGGIATVPVADLRRTPPT